MPDKEPGKAPDPEVRLKRKAAKAIAFDVWRQDWRKAHPEASQEARTAAWEAVKAEELKKARRVLAALDRAGFRVVQGKR